MADPRFVAARRVLLDALEGLDEQRHALVLVGAQAVYLHTGDADIAVAAFTTDADLAVEPALLRGEPLLAQAMERAKFYSGAQPGSWIRNVTIDGLPATVPVDLLVPEALAGPGSRGARLGEHGNRAGRRARGLEAAIIENDIIVVESMDLEDKRAFSIRRAGPTALLIAKLHKIGERQAEARPTRLKDKDALDVLRILKAIPTDRLAEGLKELQATDLAGEVTREGINLLRQLFGDEGAEGSRMAVKSTDGLANPKTIAMSCVALTEDLLAAVQR